MFALPFAQDFTLIGTTDENFVGDLNSPAPTPTKSLYLCDAVNRLFPRQASRPTSWSGRSPACARSTTTAPTSRRTSRAITCSCSTNAIGEAPLLTVYGGKITTYRQLAEAAMRQIGHFFEARAAMDRQAPRLPGGDFPPDGFDAQVAEAMRTLAVSVRSRTRGGWLRAYGRRVERVLGDAQSMDDLGDRVCRRSHGAEVRYLVEHEWAQNADDVLWRRSKLGLKATAEEYAALDRFIASLCGERGGSTA